MVYGTGVDNLAKWWTRRIGGVTMATLSSPFTGLQGLVIAFSSAEPMHPLSQSGMQVMNTSWLMLSSEDSSK